MGVKLMVQVLHETPWLSAGARGVLALLAERSDDATGRLIWHKDDVSPYVFLASNMGLSQRSIPHLLRELASHGLEVRVPSGVDSDGRPQFAYTGRRVELKMPPLGPVIEAKTAGDWCADPGTSDDGVVRRSAHDGAQNRAPSERDWCADPRTLVRSPLESVDAGATTLVPEQHRAAVSELLSRHSSLDEADAADCVAWVAANKADVDSFARYVRPFTVDDVIDKATRLRRRRGERTIRLLSSRDRCNQCRAVIAADGTCGAACSAGDERVRRTGT